METKPKTLKLNSVDDPKMKQIRVDIDKILLHEQLSESWKRERELERRNRELDKLLAYKEKIIEELCLELAYYKNHA